LDLAGTGVTLADPVDLTGLKSLRRLSLARTEVGDDRLRRLAPLSGLEELDLSGTPVTGSGLGAIAGLRELRTLRLNGAALTDDGATGLAALPQLRELDVGNPRAAPRVPAARSVRLTDLGLGSVGCCRSLRKLS